MARYLLFWANKNNTALLINYDWARAPFMCVCERATVGVLKIPSQLILLMPKAIYEIQSFIFSIEQRTVRLQHRQTDVIPLEA